MFFSESIQSTQTNLEDLHSRLKQLANEKQEKLDENLKLFQLNREMEDLKLWIADREVIASSQDIGQDFDNLQIIEERFVCVLFSQLAYFVERTFRRSKLV